MFERLFSQRGLSLDRLRSFLRVVDAGGIARAAPDSPTQQSQLSRQISELESFFGGRLVQRQGGKQGMTELGARLAEHSRYALSGLDALLVHTSAAHAGLTLRLGAGDAMLHLLFIPRLPRLMEAAPQVTFEVRALPATELVAQVREGRLDAALLPVHRSPRPLRAVPIGKFGLALFAPRPRSGRQPTLEQVLATMPVAMQTSEPEADAALSKKAKTLGIVPRIALRCETFPQALRALESRRFAAVLPTLARCVLPASDYIELGEELGGPKPRNLAVVTDPRLDRVQPELAAILRTLTPLLR